MAASTFEEVIDLTDDDNMSVVPALGRGDEEVASGAGAAIARGPSLDITKMFQPKRKPLSEMALRLLKEKPAIKELHTTLLGKTRVSCSGRYVSFLMIFSVYAERDCEKTQRIFCEHWNSIIKHLVKITHRLQSELRRVFNEKKEIAKQLHRDFVTASAKYSERLEVVSLDEPGSLNHIRPGWAAVEMYHQRYSRYHQEVFGDGHRNNGIYSSIAKLDRIAESLEATMNLQDAVVHQRQTKSTRASYPKHYINEFDDPAKTSMDDRKHFMSTIPKWPKYEDLRRRPGFQTKTVLDRHGSAIFKVFNLIDSADNYLSMLHTFENEQRTDEERDINVVGPAILRVFSALDKILLAEIPPPPPPFNGVKSILRDSDISPDDVDPVTLEPFVSGQQVFVMSCCRNKFVSESILGILQSGRTPKCPMCRASLFTSAWDGDTTWFQG